MSEKIKFWLLIVAVLAALIFAGRWRNQHRDPSEQRYSEGPHDWP